MKERGESIGEEETQEGVEEEREEEGEQKEEQNNEKPSWFEDVWNGLSDWFEDTWLGKLFGLGESMGNNGARKEEAVQAIQEAVKITHDDQGNTIVEIVDRTRLEELEDEYGLRLPEEDKMIFDEEGNEIPVQEEIPEDVLQGKILEDVPYIPQRIIINGKYSPHKEGSSMCSGASVAMIADYYGKLPNRDPKIQKVDGVDTDLDLREYVWKDKGQDLKKECYFSNPTFKVDGSFAMTSLQGCELGYVDGYKDYFNHFELKFRNVKKPQNRKFLFSDIKKAINHNHPVLFGEPGHIMVAVGYLDFPDEYKNTIYVTTQTKDYIKEEFKEEKNIAVKKDFFLVVHDPKRNRNRSKQNAYFGSDGDYSTYLIVYNPLNKIEYMCRSGSREQDKDYICISPGVIALEVYKK